MFNNNYSINQEGELVTSFKEKYQDKLQALMQKALNDDSCISDSDKQQQYILMAVFGLVEAGKTGELMRAIVDGVAEEDLSNL